MITQEQQKQSVELMNSLVEKAWESASFKEQLIKNPITTIESFTGAKVENEAKFVVEDQTNSSFVYLNIPKKIELTNLELTDEQLEIVSGGEIAATAGLALAVVGLFATGVGIGLAVSSMDK